MTISKYNIPVLLCLFSAFCILVGYYFLRMFIGYKSWYPYDHMDWDQDGHTSVSELIISSDVGKRDVIVEGVPCIEYFSFKDGLPIKVVCQDNKK